MPIIILFLCILPLAIFFNPEVIPRFLGETSHISQYGYLDLEHYIDLAENKSIDAQQTAFYPLWPYLIRIFNGIYNIDYYKTAIILSSFIGIFSMFLSKKVFSILTKNEMAAFLSFSLYILSPMSVFLLIGYSESIFALGSWTLILFIINMLFDSRDNNHSYTINSICIFSICVVLGLTRPSLPQAIFSAVAALFLTLRSNTQENKITRKKYVTISSLIIAGFIFGYVIYGFICLNNGFRFFEPFYAQQFWNKSLGIRPIYLLTSRSPLIDFMGLYYPLLLIINSFSDLQIFNLRFNYLNSIIFRNTSLTLLYPPIGFIYGLLSNKRSSSIETKISHNKYIDIRKEDKYFEDFRYIFWYASFFAFSHSLICFLTSELYLASLGRFVFGQPYFYVALSIFISSKSTHTIKHPRTLFLITILISSGMLLSNLIDFGNARLHV